MARAGYQVTIRRAGPATVGSAMTMTHLGERVHRISVSSTRVVDPNQPWSLVVSGVTLSYASVQSVDWLFGEVTTATLTAVPTLNATYMTLDTSVSTQIVAEVKSHSVSESSDLIDTTTYNAAGSPIRQRIYGLRDAEVSLDMNLTVAQSAALATLHFQGANVFFEVNSGYSMLWRGMGLIDSISRNAEVEGLVESTVTWKVNCHVDSNNRNLVTAISERLI